MANNSTGNTTTVDPADVLLQSPHLHWAATTVLVAIILTTVCANLTVILSFVIEPRLRETFNYFLLNLAISDLITGAIGMTHLTIYTSYTYWPLGYKHCTFWMYFDWVGVNETILTVAVISLDRVWAVTFPVSYYRLNTPRKAGTVIVASWVLVNAAFLPGQIYDRLYNSAMYGRYECYWSFNGPTVWSSPLFVVPVTEWIPALTILVCYVVTSVKIFQASLERLRIADAPVRDRIRAGEHRRRNEKQAFILLTLLNVSLIICWGPWFVYSAMATYYGYEDETAYTVTYWMGYAMAMINPFLFNFANADLRKTISRILRKGDMAVRPRFPTLSSTNKSDVSPSLKDPQP